jgi:D-sedoheptulose 7-phosphate isomerase
MLPNIYNSTFNGYFESEAFKGQFEATMQILKNTNKVFFIGNGGSNSICSHMYEDFAKIGKFRTFAFSDAALITCFANDYGYENAMAEWMKLYVEKGDLLFAISSSGNSPNILNASKVALEHQAKVVTLSGFTEHNQLRQIGTVNFHIPVSNYGVVECFHQVILHALLDTYSTK